jgi:hypothetical protein
MRQCPLPNVDKAIISLWFKGARSGRANPPIHAPDKLWAELDWPGTQVQNLCRPLKTGVPLPPGIVDAFVLWDPYGTVMAPFNWRAPPALIPPQPPLAHMPEPNQSMLGQVGILPHDKFNFLLSFGDPDLKYEFRKWVSKQISTFDGVLEDGITFRYWQFPPPYYPHFLTWPNNVGPPKAGTPLGNDGKLPVCNIQIDDDSLEQRSIVPQSFIAVTEKGELKIFLQTNTRAQYKGYMYIAREAKALFAYATGNPDNRVILDPTYWTYIGPYWAGWEFEYTDQSNQLMGAWPEYFQFNAGSVNNDWNHLLFSFDISGAVKVVQGSKGRDATQFVAPFIVSSSTGCKAWLALNDRNLTDGDLQNPFPTPYIGGELNGIGTDEVNLWETLGYFWSRDELKLGPNDIVPQNAYLRSQMGAPRDSMPGRAWVSRRTASGFRALTGWEDQLFPTMYMGQIGLHPGIVDPITTADPRNFDPPSYECQSFSIPIANHPIGIPGSQHHLDHNLGSDHAELQIWFGKTLDTGELLNRRLFITAEGKPQKMSVAEEVLGQPDIRLHLTNNWKKGLNTGSCGIDIDGVVKPEGQFIPVAGIERYQPEPEVGK